MQQTSPLLINTIPSPWADSLSPLLLEEEKVLSWITIDLDTRLYFADGIAIVTTQRLLVKMASDDAWQAWHYQPDVMLTQRDHAGVGYLELFDGYSRLAYWRYRLGNDLAVNRLIESFAQQRDRHLSGKVFSQDEEQAQCPRCGIALSIDQDECPVCEKQTHAPPSTWTLLRLWRFAKPYKGRLLIGFLLTLCSTAATLVPPYLTMPLMDNVLIPYQNGQPISS